MKKLICLAIIMLSMVIVTGCGSDSKDEPENPNGIYDWDIMERIYEVETNAVIDRNNYILENKTESYVISLKHDFEKKSTKFYKYKLSYQKRK